ncbi:cytospin-B isoform X1 [Pangasianodon hypophthalmus]|uniref:cytospin-B isoform X1 n=1 Tax=Pangasianodon hypophthalmus TaxID=310915 RepID=UPI0023080190|nr:cytospin-B isoform X1 [Pangasianodon hypophthalmus]XP_053086583.1 cytospin-B isoform X1 [Pangasianodon hypophthalmus]XP_053086584.1 cytospin-B isoform X1 [Pangasianodon hypophthalmus]XP_053086585.1 cytospin-B isoform X1 [Pangasianodon hypophthalmus]XP_053086586.1 cytospin-B isoform X1 [Pangasianodon hypophthalmus]XP_053086587.1 cytospin-B isoform X1 [Pangasianodon hypophthalmus]
MLRGGSTKVALPKTGAPERGRLPSSIGHTSTSSSSGSTMMKTSRSSSTIASDLRLSRLKRASSDDALAKPALGPAAPVSRLKKTVTTGAISELADNRPHSLTGIQSTKKSGIPAPRDIPQTISRDRTPLRDQLRTPSTKKMIPSASTSSLSALAKHSRSSVKSKVEAENADRALLECQVKELLAEAKAKEFEISKLRMELQRCRGKGSPQEAGTPDGTSEREQTEANSTDTQTLVEEMKEKNRCFQKELSALQQENQTLKEKLILLENSPVSCGNTITNSTSLASPTKPSVNGVVPEISSPKMAAGSPIKTSVSSGSDITKGTPSPDSSEFEKIPSCSDSVSSITKGIAPSPKEQDLSLQGLTERIQKMEESHHSTAEELQATLQELADQQQVVQELTAENERLSEEKSLLQTSLQQQRERVELLAQKNETLLQRLREQVQSQEVEASRASRAAELEQRLAEQVESSRFEREKLVDIQQQLTGSLRALEKEHQEAQAAVRGLKDELEILQQQLEREKEAGAEATRLAVEQRQAMEALRVENECLKAQVETERQKVLELNAVQSASNSTELQALLKAAHTDRDKLELSCTELKQELLQAHKDIEHIQGLLSKAEAEQQKHQERLESQEQDHKASMLALEEKSRDGENQIKDLKETIFELEDQVEQQRAVQLHTNQIILDLESQIKRLEEHKSEQEKQLKAMSKQMKDETQEWRRFQADLQTAVVVANDIKVEAQQEVRTLRRRLQEEQERSTRLAAELEHIQGARSRMEEGTLSDSDSSPQWCGIAMAQNAPGNESESSTSSEPGATVKSLIKSFDTAVKNGPASTVQIPTSPRSPLSGIPVRTAPAAAVSPIQRPSCIKPLSKTLERRINLVDSSHSVDELKPSSLMRKSPSLESVIKTPAALSSRTSSFTYSRANSKLNVERTDPLAALAREYGGSKRNALLKWCQKKTEGYPNVDVTNFSSSWSDGLAFCALLHTYLPAHIPYQELVSQDKGRNLTLAFQAAESIGIKPSLDIDELMHTDRPDWQSVMQYVSQIYKYFET